MLLEDYFAQASVIEVPDFAALLSVCAHLRARDPFKPYVLSLRKGLSEGAFVFPYSNFAIKASGHTLKGSLYAKELDQAGKELTTWRTATLKVTGSHNLFEGLSVINDSGDPVTKGQEVAVGVYGDDNVFLRCHFLSTQDTLFSGPLPSDLEERYRGFLPDEERFHEGGCRNYYLASTIEGTVDFIFGAGEAVFVNCDLVSLDDGRKEYYVTAPSHELTNEFGYFFENCRFLSQGLAPQTVYLGRPWRDFGKCVFHACQYGPHIKTEGFSEWNDLNRKLTCRFEEYPPQKGRVSWLHNKESDPLPDRYRAVVGELKAYRLK